MLEQYKKIDKSQQPMKHLQGVVETGESTKNTYIFIEKATKYDGNPEIMFDWCENLETHLLNDELETIPDKDFKKMLVSCITGAVSREITPFYQTGVAFERYETGVFFAEMMKRFSQQ